MDTPRPTNTVYYGVYTPGDNRDTDGSENVFEDKLEALKVARKNKKSRFKVFQFYHEAVEFALNGSEFPNNNISFNGSFGQRSEGSSAQIGEKASPFKGPKPQDLVELRKLIEAGECAAVRQLVWQNPRYLVSSGDTPSILQEGARYNALHVAAKSKRADIAELILNTISDVEFMKLLYGDDNQRNAEERTAVLLDLYLNTPNKALNETPLHFASKHGAADVVEVLVSYPQCDRTLKNKFNETADQVICQRTDCSDMAAVKKKIAALLQDNYYVPVLRAEDRSLPPLIGEPFSPTKPPVYNKDPLSPRLEIHAYAGPMDKKEAQKFRKIWKTPPRFSKARTETKTKSFESLSSLRFKDPDKGLERIGKSLANAYDVTWKEYWPFLGSFVDIASEEGLNLLESHLATRYAVLNSYIVEEIKRHSPERSKLNVISPISDLCAAFSSCRINDSSSRSLDKISGLDSVVYIDKACQVFANRVANDILSILSSEDGILQTLETEIKQLELLTTSYMEDGRFSSINFQKVHCRLGTLVGQKLYNNMMDDVRSFLFKSFCGKIESLLDSVTKSVDCFSSDDESHNYKDTAEQRKPTIYRKQLICLIHYVLTVLTRRQKTRYMEEEDVSRGWEVAEACPCVYHIRKFKKNYLSRNNSFKWDRSDLDGVQKRLSFEDCDQNFVQNGIKLSRNTTEESSSEDDLDEEKFYTPPSSPELLECLDTDSDDEFNDTELPKYDAFIEGDYPTKVDCDIFNALNYSDVKLDCKKYPNIYKWHHRISLFSDEERQSWTSHKEGPKKLDTPNNSFSGDSPVMCSTPSKSWMRVTGANSPKAFRSEDIR